MSIKDRLHDVSNQFNKAHMLDSLGLQEKRDPVDLILPALGIFSAGLVVGSLLGVLFAPKTGTQLRSDIRRRIDDIRSEEEENHYTG